MKVTFEDLCSPCGRAVKALLTQVGKKIEGLSPDRKPSAKPKVAAPAEAKKPADKKPASNGHQHAKS